MKAARHISVVPDPQASTCRYIGDPRHLCQTSYGAPLRAGQVCFAESLTQLAESISHNAVVVEDRLAEQDRNEADAEGRRSAAERWQDEIA